MKIPVNLARESYDITLEKGALARVGQIFDLDRKVLVVTDMGVPEGYVQTVCDACREYALVEIEAGEESKNLDNFKALCESMLQKGFTRKDCVVAVGGGVVGDLAGFAAACFMRGIDFYNVPTTLLSQVDSSVGGKTAVDFCGIKNILGAFYQPKGVLIDPEALATLDQIQLGCGKAEVIKMALSLDEELFSLIEEKGFEENLEEIIGAALKIKASVVEQDEKEGGLRRVLNFGHTLGHGIESVTGLLHGECVALGMIPMCCEALRPRLMKLLKKEGLPTSCDADPQKVVKAAMHDKKAEDSAVVTVQVNHPGAYSFVKMDSEQLLKVYEEAFL